MKHLAFRITGGFVGVVVLSIVLAGYAEIFAERALTDVVKNQQLTVSRRVLASIDGKITERIDQLHIFAGRPDVVSLVQRAAAAGLSFDESFERDQLWSASSSADPPESMTAILREPVSVALAREFVSFYSTRDGATPFRHVAITDSRGRAVAMSGWSADFDFSSDDWWDTVRRGEIFRGAFDTGAGSFAAEIEAAVPVIDAQGRFIGAVRGMITSTDIILAASGVITGRATTRIHVVLGDGRLIYSSAEHVSLENISDSPLYRGVSGSSGSFTVREPDGNVLYSFVRADSEELRNPLQVTLLVGFEEAEIAASLTALRVQVGAGAAVFVVLAVIVALSISRSVTTPVREVELAARAIAAGDLDVEIRVDRDDEVGRLAAAFQQLSVSQREMARMAEAVAKGDLTASVTRRGERDRLGTALSEMQANLRLQLGQIADASQSLAQSGSQIAASSTQLAASAAESAAAVSETTATVEEVKQTAMLSDGKAREVSEIAHETITVSRRGEESIARSQELLGRIREEFDEIGTSVTALSRRSQSIGEIIMTVGELSDQSNLLAVNAAIEAARAGEHGRAFAVVAAEIRSLAEQSKRATEQVRSLLGDVQKDVNRAVLSMEQGSKAMKEGLSQSEESGEAIRRLSEQIDRAAEAATQIAASSRQQLAGMDQVATAMENIKEATEQNVTSMREMDDEMRNLNQVGLRLSALVERYRSRETG